MEWLLIIGLIVAVVALLRRVQAAERRIEQVAQAQGELFERLRNVGDGAVGPSDPLPEPTPMASPAQPELQTPEPDRRRASVPMTIQQGGSEEHVSVPLAAETETLSPVEDLQRAGRLPFRLDLEDIFGRRLPIWAGGVTLAVAGVFLVRYSIERGLITPLLRVIMAFVFGLALLAGAEATHRARLRIADPRVGQALAGAGLATLFAAFYLAGAQYGLIGQTLAFLGLACVTAGAIALSYRFGLPSAILGLVGGFAAPALVGGGDANLPLLALYLGLVTTGLVLSGRRQQRPWLGFAALVGGLCWGAVLLTAGDFGTTEVLALGLYFVALGAVLPALAHAPQFEQGLRPAAALAASVQLALLVDAAGYSPLVWSLYLLLGAALAWLGWRRPDLREGSALAAAVAVILTAQWDGPGAVTFALVAAGLAAVFTLVPLTLVARGTDRPSDRWQLSGTAAGLATVAYLTFGDRYFGSTDLPLALGTAVLAVLPIAAGWFVRACADARPLALFAATGAALAFAALVMILPGWLSPVAAATVGAGLLAAIGGRQEPSLRNVLAGAAVITTLALAMHGRFESESLRLFGPGDGLDPLGALRWLAAGAMAAGFAAREPRHAPRRIGEAASVALVYGAFAQLLPGEAMAWVAAGMGIGLHRLLPRHPATAVAALAIATAWALQPLGRWLDATLSSFVADPVFVTDLPAPLSVTLYMLPAISALALVRLRVATLGQAPVTSAMLALPLAVVAAHIVFKQIFAIDARTGFEAMGLAERTLWQGLLLGGALAAGRVLPAIRSLWIGLAGASLAHFTLYTGLLHNPLWSAQALGPVPLANLGLAAYALAIASTLWLRRSAGPGTAPVWDGVVMLLAALGTLTLLRQIFAGSLPAAVPLGQVEDLLRSLAGIVLALFFLWLGSRRQERSWRLGSLGIMVVAVAKVFLVDAAGLDGLLRVASFMALGFSLIGIGWVYARQLRTADAP